MHDTKHLFVSKLCIYRLVLVLAQCSVPLDLYSSWLSTAVVPIQLSSLVWHWLRKAYFVAHAMWCRYSQRKSIRHVSGLYFRNEIFAYAYLFCNGAKSSNIREHKRPIQFDSHTHEYLVYNLILSFCLKYTFVGT